MIEHQNSARKFLFILTLLLGGCGGGGTSNNATPTTPITIYGWGSSSLEGIDSAMRKELRKNNLSNNFINFAHSGELTYHALVRSGIESIHLTWDQSLQAYTSSNFPSYGFTSSINGKFNGKTVVLNNEFKQNIQTYNLRDNENNLITFIEGDFQVAPVNYKTAINIIWIGKNDINNGMYNAQEVFERSKKICDSLDYANGGKCLILTHFSNTDWAKGASNWQAVQSVNQFYLNNQTGTLSTLDVANYLYGNRLWLDTGIIPTNQDKINQEQSVLPPSIAANSGHMNEIGYQAVAKLIIKQLKNTHWL